MKVWDLPDDALRHIFQFLGPADLLRAAPVCSKWCVELLLSPPPCGSKLSGIDFRQLLHPSRCVLSVSHMLPGLCCAMMCLLLHL